MKIKNENIEVETEKELTELEKQIMEWKSEFKKIFKTTIDEKDYIWRRIKRQEYSNIVQERIGDNVDEVIYNKQALVVKTVVLNVEELELAELLEEIAGLAVTISEEVLEKSGFGNFKTVEL